MGSGASKVGRAAGTSARRYPSRTKEPPPSSRPEGTAGQGPTVHPPPQQAQASQTKDQAINLDASDPHFAASLRSLGAVQPSPTLSNSSAFNPGGQSGQRDDQPDPMQNPAIQLLAARDRLAGEAERESLEVGKRGHPGRSFLDVVAIRQVLMLRDEKGLPPDEIEKHLRLKKGTVAKLGGQNGVIAGV